MTTRSRGRVLVVDDEPDIRLIVGLNLGLAGLEFGEATNGEEAIRMLSSGEWDAAVLDLAMPGTDGFAVLEALRELELFSRLPVVVLSAKGSPQAALRALNLGAHAHLTKPFSPASVAETVRELMLMDSRERDVRRSDMVERASTLDRLGMPTV